MSKNSLLLKNCRIVNSEDIFRANIYVKNEKIYAITRTKTDLYFNPDQVVDLGNKYIIPGVIDGHTHMMDPGYTDREDFITGTSAAASGGVTTVITHHRTKPPVYSREVLEEKISYLEKRAVVDFGLKCGVTPENTEELKNMWDRGITGFKIFTCDLHGVAQMRTDDLYHAFNKISSFNGTVLIHCENDKITQYNKNKLVEIGEKGNLSHSNWRSLLSEKIAVQEVLELARSTGVKLVVAHVSHPEIMRLIQEVRRDGNPVFAESCPHYFYLTLKDLAEKGPWVKFTPPMRFNTKEELEKTMWPAFNDDKVNLIGSDHCPWLKSAKSPGESNIWNAPNGIPGVETSLKLMLNAVNERYTSLNRVVKLMCENPAKIYGLFPKKGIIRPGAEADLVILNMKKENKITNQAVVSKCGWSPFDGYSIQGLPELVLLRGKIVFKDGKITGGPGYGKFVPRVD